MRLVSVRWLLPLVLLVAVAGAAGLSRANTPAAAAAQYTQYLPPTKDTFVAFAVEAPTGTLETLRAGYRIAEYLTYVQFPIQERLPTNTTIISATLKMWCKEPSVHQLPTGEARFLLKRVRGEWSEADTIYRTKPQAVEPHVLWTLKRCEKPEWRQVDVTEMVQKWYSGEYENFGWELGSEKPSPEHLFTFQSRENQSPPPLGKQPQLIITYTGGETPTVPPTETSTPTNTPTETMTPTVTDTPEPSLTPTITLTPVWTDTPTPTPTPPGIYMPISAKDGFVGIEPTAAPPTEETPPTERYRR